MMKILTGMISHETNVFSNIVTDLRKFEERALLRGREGLDFYVGTRSPIGGFIDASRAYGFDLVPTIFASASPSGKVTDEAFEALLGEVLRGIRENRDLDGVLLHLHGAGVTESSDDLEGEVLRAIREEVGGAPIISTFDFHANYTELMLREADILVGWDTYPHVDSYERSMDAGRLMKALLEGELKPTSVMKKPPMMPAPQAQYTGRHPMKTVMERACGVEKEEGVANVTVAGGFPWSDHKDVGAAVIVTTNNDAGLAEEKAQEIADLIWSLRRDFLVRPTTVREALREAMKAKGPYVLADIGDNPGGGAPSDGTFVLKAMLEMGVRDAVLAVMWDPEAVAKAIEAGVGNKVILRVGGKTDQFHGEPVEVTGRVRIISDGRFQHKGPMMTGVWTEMGRTVVLECDGIDLIIAERRLQPTDLQLYRSLGIEPTEKRIIVVKSSVHYRASHEPIAERVIELDTPGLTSPRLASLPFKRIRRPIFPLDPEMLGIVELKGFEEE
ncbi:M81 family metallopeptidase [Candidatus Bathyarchaeota archaeon]|nr:M81 family metallopeptidase [Candidatus Bathyarchaeota archaeon]